MPTTTYHTCTTCGVEVDPVDITPRGRHNVESGGCGNPVRQILQHEIDPPTLWERHWLSFSMTGLGILCAVVIVWNRFHP